MENGAAQGQTLPPATGEIFREFIFPAMSEPAMVSIVFFALVESDHRMTP